MVGFQPVSFHCTGTSTTRGRLNRGVTGISDDTYCTPEMERRSDDMCTVHYGGFATLVRYWNSRSPWFFQIDRYMEGTPGHISILLSAVTGHISVAASARHVQKSGHTPNSM